MSTTGSIRVYKGCKPIIVPKTYTKLVFENLTAVRAPLLKIYYWEHCDIDRLNEKLASNDEVIQHTMRLPSRLINSESLKLVFFLRNNSPKTLEMRLKRVKNCLCIIKSTKVGFNQFRELFQCPHRRLLTISQEIINIKENELAAMTVTSCYHMLGAQYMTYDLKCNDGRFIRLNFFIDVGYIEPSKFVISSYLMPLDVKEYRRYIQAIWINNLSCVQLPFRFSGQKHGLKIINRKLMLPPHSIFPLLVQYRPADYKNELHMKVHYNKMTGDFTIKANTIGNENTPEPNVPVLDHQCNDLLCIIYPNKIDFYSEINEHRCLLIIIHNFDQKCFEFRCKQYIIEECFEIYFQPDIFRLKPQHSKLVLVNVRVYNKPSYFTRIPAVVEVHRVCDRGTRIAQDLLGSDIESIDDPKWKIQTYIHHLNLHMNLKIEFPAIKFPEIEFDETDPKYKKPLPYATPVTIIEQLLGQKLAETNFLRPNKKPIFTKRVSYDTYLLQLEHPELMQKPVDVDKNFILKLESELLYEALDDLGKNWKFIPSEYSDQLA